MPDFRANQRLKPVVKGTVQILLKPWQTWAIGHLSRMPVPELDHLKKLVLMSSPNLPRCRFEPFPCVLSLALFTSFVSLLKMQSRTFKFIKLQDPALHTGRLHHGWAQWAHCLLTSWLSPVWLIQYRYTWIRASLALKELWYCRASIRLTTAQHEPSWDVSQCLLKTETTFSWA